MDAQDISCILLDCGYGDLDPMFEDMDSGLFSAAVDELRDYHVRIDANTVWQSAIEKAIERIFGDKLSISDFEIAANCAASSVAYIGDSKKKPDDWDTLCDKFCTLTGFNID